MMIIIYGDEWETIWRNYLYFNIQILTEIAFDYWKENKLFSSNTSICWTIERMWFMY